FTLLLSCSVRASCIHILNIALSLVSFLSLYYSRHLRYLHSFPTRRSSDLIFVGSGKSTPRPANKVAKIGTTFHSNKESCADFRQDRKSTRLNSSHVKISYAVFCLKKKKKKKKKEKKIHKKI